ncbi:hypothetical protein DFR41_10650 [Pseudacidovorax intermedius]|uniref:Uncharacterized protein n=1 Tax=Pseudacidovorax intermedius TaxID=433924 RepID=A0A370FC95_9BURK|nr:hypothetical protein [Pseudacidovorax intermedius]RDI23346.1 hypothetical protein DFR41_10650 [Pseudacidovorax intermedius]
MKPGIELPQRLEPGRVDRFGFERLERERREMLNAICAYRDAIGDYGLIGGRTDTSANDASHPLQSHDNILVPARDVPSLAALPEHANEGPLGDTGWVLLGDGWLLRAPDGHRLRLNLCERALLLAPADPKTTPSPSTRSSSSCAPPVRSIGKSRLPSQARERSSCGS